MSWISRRAQAEQAAAMTRLRDQIADLKAELAEQGRANGRLAARIVAAQTTTDGAFAALRSAHKGQHEEMARLRTLVDQQRTTIRGLNNQLEHALGYTPEEIAILDAGTVTSR
jgi:ABC-type transporter Mla subunit MlaD